MSTCPPDNAILLGSTRCYQPLAVPDRLRRGCRTCYWLGFVRLRFEYLVTLAVGEPNCQAVRGISQAFWIRIRVVSVSSSPAGFCRLCPVL